MPTYLHPGVYIEEVPGGARPIEAVGTSTAAFVGIAVKGPLDEARFITNFSEYQETYGGYVSDNFVGNRTWRIPFFTSFKTGEPPATSYGWKTATGQPRWIFTRRKGCAP